MFRENFSEVNAANDAKGVVEDYEGAVSDGEIQDPFGDLPQETAYESLEELAAATGKTVEELQKMAEENTHDN
jgi:hypothetical protein